jgi:hypothetical protein
MVPDIPGAIHGYGGPVDVNLGAQAALDGILTGQERRKRQKNYRYLLTHKRLSTYEQKSCHRGYVKYCHYRKIRQFAHDKYTIIHKKIKSHRDFDDFRLKPPLPDPA